MDHRRTPRCLSGVRFGLPRWRLRRRPWRAKAVRRRRRGQRVRRLFVEQLLAGADRCGAANLRAESRPRLADGALSRRARREVLRHRAGFRQGQQDVLRLHPVGRGRAARFRSEPASLCRRRRQLHRHHNRFRSNRAIDRRAVLTGRHAGARARSVQVRQQHGARGVRLAEPAGLCGIRRSVPRPVRRFPRERQRPVLRTVRSRQKSCS